MIIDELRQQLDEILTPWAKAQGLEGLPPYSLEIPPKGIDADMSSNIAFVLAKQLKRPPMEIAAEIEKLLKEKLNI